MSLVRNFSPIFLKELNLPNSFEHRRKFLSFKKNCLTKGKCCFAFFTLKLVLKSH